MTTFGATVRFLRQQRRLTQNDLSELVGVSIAGISRWERDMVRPRWATMLRLADTLGCTVEYLMNGGDGSTPTADDERIAALERRVGEQDRRIADLETRVYAGGRWSGE